MIIVNKSWCAKFERFLWHVWLFKFQIWNFSFTQCDWKLCFLWRKYAILFLMNFFDILLKNFKRNAQFLLVYMFCEILHFSQGIVATIIKLYKDLKSWERKNKSLKYIKWRNLFFFVLWLPDLPNNILGWGGAYNITLWRERLNIATNIHKTNKHLSNHRRSQHVGYPAPGLGQPQKWCIIKWVNGI